MGFRLIRFVNPLILAVLAVLTLSGVYGLFWPFPAWMFDAHRLAGWLLVAAIPWKVAISWKSLRRGIEPDFDRGVMTGVSLLLAVLTLAILALGLAWGFRLGPGILATAVCNLLALDAGAGLPGSACPAHLAPLAASPGRFSPGGRL
jgi:hypothetical protein